MPRLHALLMSLMLAFTLFIGAPATAQEMYSAPPDDVVLGLDAPEVPEGWTTVHGTYVLVHGRPEDERILLALEAEGVTLPAPAAPQVAVIVAGDEDERRAAQILARRLRRRFRVDVDLLSRGLGGQMRAADKAGARFAVLVGSGELESGTWTVKEMATGEQNTVADGDLETSLAAMLDEE